jgi:hypothetical protein
MIIFHWTEAVCHAHKFSHGQWALFAAELPIPGKTIRPCCGSDARKTVMQVEGVDGPVIMRLVHDALSSA